jgi:hypothetical protein
MANTTDYLISATGGLIFENGDFAKGDCTQKHQHDLLRVVPGQFTQSPTCGVGIVKFINAESTGDDLSYSIQKEFEADGMTIHHLAIDSNSINITASYD